MSDHLWVLASAFAGYCLGEVFCVLLNVVRRRIDGDMSDTKATAEGFRRWGRRAFAAKFNGGERCVGVTRRVDGVRSSLLASGRTWNEAFANAEYIDTLGKMEEGEMFKGMTVRPSDYERAGVCLPVGPDPTEEEK